MGYEGIGMVIIKKNNNVKKQRLIDVNLDLQCKRYSNL